MVLKTLTIYVILCVSGLAYGNTNLGYNFETDLFDSVNIVHASGKIKVINSDKEAPAHLNLLTDISKKDCDVSYKIENRVLNIINEKKIFVLKSECTQDIELLVPENKKLKISMGVGEINFFGTFSSLDADLGSGKIDVKGKVEDLDLDVGAGSVSVSGLDGYGKITLLSGDLDVKYDSPQKKLNQLFVSKSVGDTKIQIPKGAKAESKLKTLMGRISNHIKPSRRGAFYFSIKTNVGDIFMDTY